MKKYEKTVCLTTATGNLAIMSIETYERLVAKFELHAMLEKGFEDIGNCRVKPAREVFERIKGRLA